MGIVVDLIIIAIVALFTFIGYKQGLIKSAIKILSFFIAIIVALILYKPVANVIMYNTPLGDNIKSTMVNNMLPEGVSADEEVDIVNSIPNMIIEKSKDTVNNVAETITMKIIETGTLLLIFTIVKFGLRFVTFLTDIITKLPILHEFDKIGGLIYGILRGVMLVLVILAMILLFSPTIEENTINAINESWIGSIIYNNNIILKVIM